MKVSLNGDEKAEKGKNYVASHLKSMISPREANMVLLKAGGANADVTSAASTLCILVPPNLIGHRHNWPRKRMSS